MESLLNSFLRGANYEVDVMGPIESEWKGTLVIDRGTSEHAGHLD